MRGSPPPVDAVSIKERWRATAGRVNEQLLGSSAELTQMACASAQRATATLTAGSSVQVTTRRLPTTSSRSDTAPCQEGGQLVRHAGLGHPVKSLAAAVGRSQGHVRTRLKLIELPNGAQPLIDDGTWTIEEGLEALKLLEDPELLTEIIERPHHIHRHVRKALDQIGFDAAKAELLERIERKRELWSSTMFRGAAADSTPLGIDPKDHASEEFPAHDLHGVTYLLDEHTR